MIAGRLRNSITIQVASGTVQGSGATAKAWTTFATGWADIRTPTGKEFFAQDKFNRQASHVVTMRWIDGVTAGMRILWGAKTLNIEYVSEDRKNCRTLYLHCKEVVNG